MPEGFKVGSAYIEVDADADVAIQKIVRQIKAAKARIGAAADDAGQDFGRKFGSGAEKQLKGAKGRLGAAADGVGETIGKRVSSSMSKSLKLGDGIDAKGVGLQVGVDLGDGVDEGASRSISKSPKTKKALDSVAERSQLQFQGLVFAGAFAGMPAAAAIAAAATVGALGIIPLALVAGAAKIQAGNEDVAKSYTRLADTATGVMQRASSVLVDGLVSGTDRLTAGMRKLEPAMTGAFRLSAPAIDGLVSSVLVLTDEALPGVVTGLAKTGTVMKGVEELARGTGRGISDFFTNISAGAGSAATNMGTLGRIIQELLGSTGQLLANLSNGGTAILPMFANALSGIYSVLLNLTSGGFSPLFAAASGFITVISGAIAIVDGLTAAFSGVLSPIAAVAGAFLALNLITRGMAWTALTAQFAGLGTAVGAAVGPLAKFKTAMSGIGAAVFSPVGLAIAGVVGALALLGMAQQRAAQSAAEHKARVADLSAVLRENNGAINESVRASAAKTLGDMQMSTSGKSVLQVARELGVSLPDLTSAYLGNASAQQRVNEQLQTRANVAGDKVMAGKEATEGERAEALAATALQQELKGTNTEYGKSVQHNKDLAAASAGTAGAMQNTTPALQAAAQGAGKLASAYDTLFSPLSSVTDKANALIAVMDRLAGRTPSYEESVQGMNDTLRSMEAALAAGIDKTKGWGDALLNADGTVSTFTENGSTLQNNLVGLQSGFANAAGSIQSLVEGGMSYKAAAEQVNGVLMTQRDRFIESAAQMGTTRDQAAALADKYGLIPSQVTTLVTDMGSAVSTSADVDALRARLSGLPANTPIRVESITAEAEQRLVDLNYNVTHMKDGSVLISTNAPAVQGQIQGVADRMASLQSKTITITINEIRNAQSYSSSVGSIGGQATGGPQRWRMDPRKRASGGPTPFLSGLAGARLTGERGPEIDFPSRSSYVATAQQTQRMEGAVKAAQRVSEASGALSVSRDRQGNVINIEIKVYPTPSMDIDALTAKISRKLGRVLKGGS